MKYLIVTGLMRSGTTFLANLLNSQNQIMCYRDILVTLRDHASLFNENGLYTSNEAKNIILSSLESELIALFGEYKINRTNDNIFDTVKEVLNTINNKFHHKNEYLGVKITTCRNLVNKLIDQSNFDFINIIRDPRDVVISAKNRFIGNPYYRIIEWKEYYKESKINEKNHTNFINVYYEEIIEKEVGKMEELLNMEIDTEIKYLKDRNNNSWSDNSSFGDIKEVFDNKAIGRWKKSIESDNDVAATQYLCRKEINEIGYELLNNEISILNKLQYSTLYYFYKTLKNIKKH